MCAFRLHICFPLGANGTLQLQIQLDTGLIQFIQTNSGIMGKLEELLLPPKNQRDQAILNYIFHTRKNRSLTMPEKYNMLLYEHTATSKEVLQYADLIHLIHTKPWKEPRCYLRYNHWKICDIWFATPTVLVSDNWKKRRVFYVHIDANESDNICAVLHLYTAREAFVISYFHSLLLDIWSWNTVSTLITWAPINFIKYVVRISSSPYNCVGFKTIHHCFTACAFKIYNMPEV